MASRWPWNKLRSGRGLNSGFVCAAMAAAGFAIWKKDDLRKETANVSCEAKLREINSDKNAFINATNFYNSKLNTSIEKAKDFCQMVKDDYGLPGLVISVAVNGKVVWEEGLGYSDIENRVPMKPNAVLRIASISKSMTAAMLAKLIEDGKINLDCPIQTYLPDYPKKTVDGEAVTITTRHLLSHMSGIRHYEKKGEEKPNHEEMESKEYFKKEKFNSLKESMELFQNDELFHKPGSKYLYTTHGFTVLSAIIEKITETPFPKHATKMFNFWGLQNTYLDEHEPLVYNRTRYYTRNKHGRLVNSPYVDNSYKWAGGGFQSTVTDLVQFAHILLASFQFDGNQNSKDFRGLPNQTYIKQSTVQQIWTPVPNAAADKDADSQYGMGFVIGSPLRKCLFCKEMQCMAVSHSGGAVGASSILFISFPKDFRFGKGCDEVDGKIRPLAIGKDNNGPEEEHVKGIVVAMITNMTSVSLSNTAVKIAEQFKWMCDF